METPEQYRDWANHVEDTEAHHRHKPSVGDVAAALHDLADLIEAHAKLKKHAEEVERIVREECAREREGPFSEAFEELGRAIKKFPTWPTDPLHALAVLGEEFGELTKAMLQLTYEPTKSSQVDVRCEAIQTAAMALRLVASLPEYQYVRAQQHTQTAIREGKT